MREDDRVLEWTVRIWFVRNKNYFILVQLSSCSGMFRKQRGMNGIFNYYLDKLVLCVFFTGITCTTYF